MPDLKAAAKWLRETAGNYLTAQEREHNEIAAQALEAWAWMAAQSMPIEIALKRWRILGRDQRGHLRYYYADTPLGAVLAAMEGELDA